MADYKLVLTTDENAQPIFDRVQTPTGDWALVSGPDLVAQNILVFLLTQKGTHPTDPTFGIDPLVGENYTTAEMFELQLAACESYFLDAQARSAVPLDEQLASIGPPAVSVADLNAYTISFTVYTRSGASATARLTQLAS